MFLSYRRQEGPAISDPALFANAGNFSNRVSVCQGPGDCLHLAVLLDLRADGYAVDVFCPRLSGEKQEDC